ncbi:ribosome silencing factor [Agromyces seonyuensis]|uniref:Ribosomal silencing factor RsfS n=1 Tax=Agromyces seonyuensis TaxID=2662446 RepID=A0A6I4NVC5_9MICO|nr:ribosome silencing factor [Agromyces seonyuensis]MWB98406.1 ribosome silencing factor [Agromyces seonyuensis]
MTASDQALELLALAAQAADKTGGEEFVALDVSEHLPFADVFLLVTGNSERNVTAIADAIDRALGEAGAPAPRREGRAGGHWELLDFNGLVVHVFHSEDRLYYGLERLWRDCPVLPVELAPVAGESD